MAEEPSGLPSCTDMLQNEQKRIASAITECESWAARPRVLAFWNARRELVRTT